VVEAADLRKSDDTSAVEWLDGARFGCVLVESEVCARGVVVAEVTAQATTKVLLVEDDEVVEKLTADGADHPFGERVLPRRTWRCENLGDANPFDSLPELFAVGAIAIAQNEARCRVSRECLYNLLCGPS
jgi:hypothetical protein